MRGADEEDMLAKTGRGVLLVVDDAKAVRDVVADEGICLAMLFRRRVAMLWCSRENSPMSGSTIPRVCASLILLYSIQLKLQGGEGAGFPATPHPRGAR